MQKLDGKYPRMQKLNGKYARMQKANENRKKFQEGHEYIASGSQDSQESRKEFPEGEKILKKSISSSPRKMDQRMGEPARKEGNMEDCQKTMEDGVKLMVKMKTLEIRSDTLRGSQNKVRGLEATERNRVGQEDEEMKPPDEMTYEVPDETPKETVNRQDRLKNLVKDDDKTLRVEPEDEKTIGRELEGPLRPKIPVLESYTEAAQQHTDNKKKNLFSVVQDEVWIPDRDEDYPEGGMKMCL